MNVLVTVPTIRNGQIVSYSQYRGKLTGITRGDLNQVDIGGYILWVKPEAFVRV